MVAKRGKEMSRSQLKDGYFGVLKKQQQPEQ
jgi:hypothetical protein